MKIALARACALASLLALALATWLYFPGHTRSLARESRGLCVCLVDTSRSATTRRTDQAAWTSTALRAEAESARDAHEDLCVLEFAAEVKRAFGPRSPEEYLARAADERSSRRDTSSHEDTGSQGKTSSSENTSSRGSELSGDESRLKSALDLAREVLADRPPELSRLRLYVDGTYTGADPRPELARIADSGVAIEWVELPPATAPDLALARIVAPERPEAGAPLGIACDVLLRSGPHAPASLAPRLEVRIARPSGATVRELRLEPPANAARDADGYVAWRVRCDLGRAEPGLTRVEVTAQATGDALPENDSAAAVIPCGDKLVIGFVGGDGAGNVAPSWLRKIAASGGAQVLAVTASALDRELSALDVLVTGDVPFERLPASFIASFLERGGGWLSLAGYDAWRAYLGGDPRASATGAREHVLSMVAMLPLAPLERETPPRDVLFVIDGSGSMVGEPFDRARAAIEPLMTLAGARDSVGVCTFSGRLGETMPLFTGADARAPSEALRAARATLAGLDAPGGPTALLRSLEDLADRRAQSGRECLVLLFSDGRDVSDPRPEARCRGIVQRLAAAHTKLVVVAVGDDPDRALLGALVPEGQRLIEVRELAGERALRAVRELFERELGSERMRAENAIAVLPARELADAGASGADASVFGANSGLAREVLAAELRAVPDAWPSIQRFVRARKAEAAAVLWRTRDGEPLLGLQRVGLGASAACAFAIPDWAAAWSERDDLLGPLVRALGRGKRERGPSVSVAGGELLVENLPLDAPADLEAWIFAQDAEMSHELGSNPIARVPLAPPTSGEDPRPRRTGSLPAEMSSSRVAWRIEVRRRGARAEERALLELPLVLERAPEFRYPRMRIAPASAADLSTAARADRAGRVRDVSPHAAAMPLFATGLALLAATAILGFFARRAT